MYTEVLVTGAVAALVLVAHAARARLRLSRAKHRSLAGHSRWARRLAKLLPYYGFDAQRFFDSDGAPAAIAAQRKAGLATLRTRLQLDCPQSQALTARLEASLPDLAFTNAYRVPFQYRQTLGEQLRVGAVAVSSHGAQIRDADGHDRYDLSGSYGVNVFGYEFYKQCIADGVRRAAALGPVLGPYHPAVASNAERLREISGLDAVSFHMSGTEAVMQAVRLACYHTRRTHLVRFCGAYHGWWGDVQPGIGNPVPAPHTYTLEDMADTALLVLETRRDIACVLVNPLQALHPNAPAPGDGSLLTTRGAHFDRAAYGAWLARLREVCTRRGIVLVFDEVFMGFRLAAGGAQAYFGVTADLVTYGKTVAGGLPIGVVCGRHDLMQRYHPDRPGDICFARGTFNSHPYVMTAMASFLERIQHPDIVALYDGLDARWNARAATLNQRLDDLGLPLRVTNLSSVWTVCYTQPSRYHWMFQFYLRSAGLALSWVGTGRLIFSIDYSDDDLDEVFRRFVGAAVAMRDDGWWWCPPGVDAHDIRRRLVGEMLAARFGMRTADRHE